MAGILLPEFTIHRILNGIVKMLRDDIKNASSDEETILYRILGLDEDDRPIQINYYNVFEQAKKIFSTPNNLTVNFGYNQEVANIISLHILLPSESGSMTIGADEGYIEEPIYEGGNLKEVQRYYTQTYDSTYQIMITSNNSAEVNVVYNVLKSMLLMLTPQIDLMGLRLPVLSGNDIVMQDNLAPVPIFHKVLNMSFKYEHNVPKPLADEVVRIMFKGKLI